MWIEPVVYWAKWGMCSCYVVMQHRPPKWLGVGVCHQGVVMQHTKALGSLDQDSVAFKLVLLQLVVIPRVPCL